MARKVKVQVSVVCCWFGFIVLGQLRCFDIKVHSVLSECHNLVSVLYYSL